jgi:hypothetical protein
VSEKWILNPKARDDSVLLGSSRAMFTMNGKRCAWELHQASCNEQRESPRHGDMWIGIYYEGDGKEGDVVSLRVNEEALGALRDMLNERYSEAAE